MTQKVPIVPKLPDFLTLVAISALAYICAVAIHEHLGHTTACLLLGGQAIEIGAFYVDCDYTNLGSTAIRLVALAGPFISLITGLLAFYALKHISIKRSIQFYFVWLLGTISVMTATGYMLFSGISGIGDFGLTQDGVFYQITPAWLWQILLTLAGALSYFFIILWAIRKIDSYVPGEGRARITYTRKLLLISYLTGAVVYILIGLLNPHGFFIVLASSVAASVGGTSGFLWMGQLIDIKRDSSQQGISFQRSWTWVSIAFVSCALYALFLGPTINF
ncbi:MAG: hypothetical protein KC422_20035 [Trueperaceae bacterium]|nr:hypothetical protein [Trueperaceae bacterium]